MWEKSKYLFWGVFLLGLFPIGAQCQTDSLFLRFSEDSKPYILHRISKKETLFSIAKNYKTSIELLVEINSKKDLNIQKGGVLKIPYQSDLIFTENANKENTFKPIYYRIEKEDRLFHIISRVLDLSWRKIKRLNPNLEKSDNTLSVITLGWLDLSEFDKTTEPKEVIEPIEMQDEAENTENIEPLSFKHTKKGLAYWEKSYPDNGRFYALHSFAAINSTIEISNPISGRKVYAKVIGRIPGVYPPDADVIVTNEVARELGNFNRRFYVEVKYGQ
jgi:LysM domain